MATSSTPPEALVRTCTPDAIAPVAPRRILRGFGNLLHNEQRAWWGTRKWLVHLVIWAAIISGFVGLIAWAEGREGRPAADVYAEVVQLFFIVGSMVAALGVVSTTQGAIVGEKQLGTAAWSMSKPVSRSAFVLAKLVAHAGAFVVLAVGLPVLVFCIQSLGAGWGLPPLVPFAGGGQREGDGLTGDGLCDNGIGHSGYSPFCLAPVMNLAGCGIVSQSPRAP